MKPKGQRTREGRRALDTNADLTHVKEKHKKDWVERASVYTFTAVLRVSFRPMVGGGGEGGGEELLFPC